MVVVRKNISVEKGEHVLFPEVRYFFYITNEWECTAAEVVFEANDRCNQENYIAQLKSGVPALHAPVDNLESNWAYMLMMALAWNLKAWWALTLPETPGNLRKTSRRKTMGSEVGIQDLPERVYASAMPNRQNRPQAGLPPVGLETTPAYLLQAARCVELLSL